MASDKEFFLKAFDTILGHLNPDERSRVSESLAEACAAASRERTTASMGVEAANNVTEQKADPEPKPFSTAAILRAHKRQESMTGSKRVVNGFICFRCKSPSAQQTSQCTNMFPAFYCTLFEGLAQRFKSGYLRQMWSMESRRNIFGLLGRAFSDLRDNHGEVVSMESFLAVASEVVPLVPANEYLALMGWLLRTGVGGDIDLVRDTKFNVDIVNARYPPRSSLSAADIVEHCYVRGFLDRGTRKSSSGSDAARHPQGGSVNMAVSAAPPQPPPQHCLNLVVAQQQQTVSSER